MMSDELRPCRNCGNLPETDYWRSAVWCTSSRDECPYSYLAQTPDQWHGDTFREKALRANLATWQAHSAGLAVMNKALEELVETMRDNESCCKRTERLLRTQAEIEGGWLFYGGPTDTKKRLRQAKIKQKRARQKLQVARAKVAELKGENP